MEAFGDSEDGQARGRRRPRDEEEEEDGDMEEEEDGDMEEEEEEEYRQQGEGQGGEEEDEEDEEEEVNVNLTNIVATVQLGAPIDVERVAITVSNAEYNPRRFSAVILRVREPRTTALVFKSGKMVVTGARSEEDSLAAAHKYVAILQKVGCSATCRDFRIQNMTAMWNLGFPVRLEGLLFAHAAQSTYEPELFPGLVFRLQDPKVVFIVFVSGKVVITGVKSMAALEHGVGAFLPVLTAFRKKPLLLLGLGAGSAAASRAKKQKRLG